MTKLEAAYIIIMMITFCCDSLDVFSREPSTIKLAIISSTISKIVRIMSVLAIFYFRYWR